MGISFTLTVLSVKYLMDISNRAEWVRCPVCGTKTRLQIRADTELKNFHQKTECFFIPYCVTKVIEKAGKKRFVSYSPFSAPYMAAPLFSLLVDTVL